MMKKEVSSLVLSMALVGFIGCGGGSGGSSEEPTEAVDQNIEQPQTEESVQEDTQEVDTSPEEITTPSVRTLPIKKTGQVKSFNADGEEVTDGSIRDDGYYQRGIAPNYTRASDIVTDEVTHLMWQDNEDVGTVTKQWATDENYENCENSESAEDCSNTSGDTATTYCTELSLGGYEDWRLPSFEELTTIVNYDTDSEKAIDTDVFQYIGPEDRKNRYWTTKSTYNEVWFIDFYSTYMFIDESNNSHYVRCVRDAE